MPDPTWCAGEVDPGKDWDREEGGRGEGREGWEGRGWKRRRGEEGEREENGPNPQETSSLALQVVACLRLCLNAHVRAVFANMIVFCV